MALLAGVELAKFWNQEPGEGFDDLLRQFDFGRFLRLAIADDAFPLYVIFKVHQLASPTYCGEAAVCSFGVGDYSE